MKIFSLILDHPKKTVLSICIITSLFCISIFDLSYDFTIEQLFAKDKQETEQYFDFQNEFSREDNVFLLVHKNPTLINNQFLNSLEDTINKANIKNVRAILITSKIKHFCSGADPDFFLKLPQTRAI